MGINNHIHIGKIIRARLNEQNMSCAEFARQLCIERSSVYGIFSKSSIDIERLKRISEILDFDFISAYYSPRNDTGIQTSLNLDKSALSALQQGEAVYVKLRIADDREK